MDDRRLPAAITRRVEAMLGDDGPPGAAVALAVDGRLWTSGIGDRDLDRRRPLAADAVFYIYSVTKPMLAVATLDLVGRGQVELDDAVVSILREVPLDRRITVRHLLNHTGGLGDYGSTAAYDADLRRDPGSPWTSDEFLTRVLAAGPRFAPGEGWAYSNIGYLLLRRIVEQVSGTSLRKRLAAKVVEPLGLRHAQVADTLADAAILTPGYSDTFAPDGAGPMVDVAPLYHPGWVSHGVVAATAAEVATFLEALLGGRLLPPELLADMLHGVEVPGSPALFSRPTYGLGLMVDPGSRFGLVAGHGGSGPGYSAGAFQFADVRGRRVTSVALVNSDRRDLGMDLAFAMVELLADEWA